MIMIIVITITIIIIHPKPRFYVVFGGRCPKIRDVCMDFEAYFKVQNLVYVHPKSTSILIG